MRIIIKSTQEPGRHEVAWDDSGQAGTHMTTGVYYACLELKDHAQTVKLLYLK